MKHLVAILAHKNPAHLELLVKECTDRDYHVLIHLDKKSRESILSDAPSLVKYTVDESIDVDRAHHSILSATYVLLEASLSIDFQYFHLISGEDFIVKSAREFHYFFSKNSGCNFLNHISIPVTTAYSESIDERFKDYTTFQDKMPAKNYMFSFFKNGIGLVDTYHFRPSSMLAKFFKVLTPTYRLRQLYLRIFKRKLPNMDFYAGSAWFSVTKDLATYYTTYRKEKPELYKYLKNGLFPDEVYFQTITMQSKYKKTMVNSDLRYIDWSRPVNDGPSHTTLECIPKIASSNGFFARKFDLARNPKLKEKVYQLFYDTH